jgi:hypothetical protein
MIMNLILDYPFFELEEWSDAVRTAEASDSAVYSWKSVGISNWLERVISNVDTIGLVVLPKSLPEHIEMPDDWDDES